MNTKGSLAGLVAASLIAAVFFQTAAAPVSSSRTLDESLANAELWPLAENSRKLAY